MTHVSGGCRAHFQVAKHLVGLEPVGEAGDAAPPAVVLQNAQLVGLHRLQALHVACMMP